MMLVATNSLDLGYIISFFDVIAVVTNLNLPQINYTAKTQGALTQ